MQFQNLLSDTPVVSRAALASARHVVWVRAVGASLLMLSAAGCEDDLGKCDETKARTLVINGEGQALYAGQAVLNDSCAAGQCHSSSAKGSDRQGAPAGLDFDLQPAAVVPPAGEGGVPSAGLSLNSKQLSNLRANQRIVFDEREEIWEQIQDGLMPPDGIGENYRKAVPGGDVTVAGSTCKRGDEDVSPISKGSTKTILRNWLACGAPVVEASNASVPVSTLMQDPAGRPGTVGQQMPFCKDCDAPVTFDELYDNVIATSCVSGCHTKDVAFGDFVIDGIDVAYKVLTEDTGGSEDCNGKDVPLVVPGKPEESYIIAKMGGKDAPMLTLCGATMPYGQAVLECGVKQMARWIKDGAKGPGEAAGMSSDAGM